MASEDLGSETQVIVTLTSLPLIGKEPVTPRMADQADNAPNITFRLARDNIPRFQQALKSRGLVRHVQCIGSKATESLSEWYCKYSEGCQVVGIGISCEVGNGPYGKTRGTCGGESEFGL